MKKKVAIQGIAGSYHDIAARNYHEGEEIEIIPCNTFRDVITTIKKDPAILGMMAIENTIAGSLLQNHELIRESGLSVTGEYKLRISHSLVALPGTSIHEVTEVNSHPIALMQCTDFLDTLRRYAGNWLPRSTRWKSLPRGSKLTNGISPASSL